MGQYLDKTGLGTLWNKIKNGFAAKTDLNNYETINNAEQKYARKSDITNVVKTDNDFSASNKIVLTGSGKNITGSSVAITNDSTLFNTNDSNAIISYVPSLLAVKNYTEGKFATKNELTSAMHYKGTKASYSDLPTTDNVLGDVWNVTDTGKNYAWNGTTWDELSGVTDLSAYLTKTEAGNTYAVKTDLDSYLTKTAASNTYVPKTSSGSDAQANITNTNGEVSITSAENGISVVPEGVGLFSATQDGMNVFTVNDEGAFMNSNQVLDSSMALTETEINNICK